jgi:hypothetical protein
MRFNGTEKEAWMLLMILMISFEIDSGMMQFPYALSQQISTDLDFTMQQVYMMISIAGLPMSILSMFTAGAMQKHSLKIFCTAKVLIIISWLVSIAAFTHADFISCCVARIINQIGNFLEFTCVIFLSDLKFRPFGKTTYPYGLRPLCGAIIVTFSFRLLPRVYWNNDKSLVYTLWVTLGVTLMGTVLGMIYVWW